MSQHLRLVIPVDWDSDEALVDIEDQVKQYVLEGINDFLMDAWLEKR